MELTIYFVSPGSASEALQTLPFDSLQSARNHAFDEYGSEGDEMIYRVVVTIDPSALSRVTN